MRALLLLLPLVFLTACPDPSAAPEGEAPAGGGPPPADGAPAPADAGGGGGAPGGRPSPVGFGIAAGEGVKVSGTIAYTGSAKGTIYFDVLSRGQDALPTLIHSGEVAAPGPFEFEAKKDFGEVFIVAFLDANGTGSTPEATEPAGRVAGAVKVGSEPISGLAITLSDTPDLGDLTPTGGAGGAAPTSAPAAPAADAAGAPPAPATPAPEGTTSAGAVPAPAAAPAAPAQ